jgi:hypothetical protein
MSERRLPRGLPTVSQGRNRKSVNASLGNANDEVEAPHLSAVMVRIVKWIDKIATPEFQEFRRNRIGYYLVDDFLSEVLWPDGIA